MSLAVARRTKEKEMLDQTPQREVCKIARAERLLLWSMRAWYASACERVPVRGVLHQLFAVEGIAQSLPAFERMMNSMFNGLRDWPEIRCLRSEWMGRHERHMLSAIAALQHGDEFTARRLLRDWLDPEAVSSVAKHAVIWAQSARAARLLLAAPTLIETRDHLGELAHANTTNVSRLR
jgi:hypothetical protein